MGGITGGFDGNLFDILLELGVTKIESPLDGLVVEGFDGFFAFFCLENISPWGRIQLGGSSGRVLAEEGDWTEAAIGTGKDSTMISEGVVSIQA